MSFPLTYRDAMTRLARLTEPGNPPAIQHQALTVIIRELSPDHPRHEDILRALKPDPSPNPTFPEAQLSSQQQKAFHLHPVEPDPDLPADPETLPTDDDSLEEEDDPW